ncbi:MAG: chemotaxis protein CheX [Desulfovibrionaceae bacterium]
MVKSLQSVVAGAVSATMEEMFFIEASSSDYLWSRVRVLEPCEGAVTMVFPRKLLTLAAAAIFGEDERIREQTLWDTLAEIVNTVAGRILGELLSEDRTFKLSVPESGTGWPSKSGDPEIYMTESGGFVVMTSGLEALGN